MAKKGKQPVPSPEEFRRDYVRLYDRVEQGPSPQVNRMIEADVARWLKRLKIQPRKA